MKFKTHKHGDTAARVHVTSNGEVWIAVNAYGITTYLPVELLQPIQDDLWALDTSGHNARKTK